MTSDAEREKTTLRNALRMFELRLSMMIDYWKCRPGEPDSDKVDVLMMEKARKWLHSCTHPLTEAQREEWFNKIALPDQSEYQRGHEKDHYAHLLSAVTPDGDKRDDLNDLSEEQNDDQL